MQRHIAAALLVLLVIAPFGACDRAPQGGTIRRNADPAPAKVERRVRPPAVAGSWYPSDPAELVKELDSYLALDPKVGSAALTMTTGTVRALIEPHAGYRYSGRTAGAGYRLVAGKRFERVIVIGPAHSGHFRGLSIADVTHYRTPLGDVELDLDAVRQLRGDSMVGAIAQADVDEHSIEMQLPLLQRALAPGWKLVPILVGTAKDATDYERAGELLGPLADAGTLIIASGDFTHYGPNYDYLPFPTDGETPEKLRVLDMGAAEAIVAGEAAGWAKYREATGITACGFGPVSILLHLASPSGARAELVSYDTSGAISGSYSNSVSYLTFAFTSASPLGGKQSETELPKPQMELLWELATRAVRKAVNEGPLAARPEALIADSEVPPRLRQKSGAFITLKKDGNLRGCIGHIQPIEPLYRAVIDNAVSAALEDNRFSPVLGEELDSLSLEVSVLSPPEAVASYEAIEIGRHGIVLSKAQRRAVFLPEVPIEQGWDRDVTLTHLARKAGLGADAWRSGAQFEVFTSQVLTAPMAR